LKKQQALFVTDQGSQKNWTRYAFVLSRLLLGGIFVYASYDKILHPVPFAEIIYNYQILPDVLVNLVSLFLPWFTILIFSLSAVQLLGLFKGVGASSMRYGAGATLALARLLIALIPVGCVAVIAIALRGSSAILIGKITGLLPLVVFLLFFVQGSNVLSVMGAGFVIAILAGLGLFAFSRGG